MIVNIVDQEKNKDLYRKYNNPLEINKIKELLNVDELEYVSDVIKNILEISIKNDVSKGNIESSLRTILYIRLSEEDGDLIDGDISRSIRDQLLMLLNECNNRKWKVIGIFCEDGLSGGDDNRPEWKRALKFCENGKTDIIFCKSQSRFSRSIEMIEKYLHKEFVEWNIRFVSLVDFIDTSVKENKKIRQITGLVNEWQLEETSQNIKHIKTNKAENGLFTSANPPYGYLRDPKDKEHLIIDEEAAKVIRRIFREYLNGIKCSNIAKEFNEERILTRIEHMKKVGVNVGRNCKDKIIRYEVEINDTVEKILKRFKLNIEDIFKYNDLDNFEMIKGTWTIKNQETKKTILNIPKPFMWNGSVVRSILKNEMYTGYLIYGKKENKSYKDRTKVNVSEDKWIKVPNCFDAIVTREEWEMANKKLCENRSDNCQERTQRNFFAKKLRCMCCGRAMQITPGRLRNKEDYLLVCKTSGNEGAFCDNRKTIRKTEVEKIVLENINNQIKKFYNADICKSKMQNQILNNENKRETILNKKLLSIECELEKKVNYLNLLYEDRTNGIVTINEFSNLKKDIDDKIRELKSKREILNNEMTNLNTEKADELNRKELFLKYQKVDKLTKDVLNEFIDTIYIGKYDEKTNLREMKILWNIKKERK